MDYQGIAELSCNLCFDVYREESNFPQYNRVKVENGRSIAFIYETEEYNVLSFRGTDDWGDWIANLTVFTFRVKEVKYTGYNPFKVNMNAKVHLGFMKSFFRLYRELDKKVKEVSNGKKWIVCGHSLGGAMASLAVLKLPIPQPALVTFGAPVWGNDDANWTVCQMSSMNLNFINGSDIVTWIYRPLRPKACPPILLTSENAGHWFKSHREYRQALGLESSW